MHSGALHYIVWLCIVLHSLHGIAFHGFALNCTTLYYIHRAARLHCLHCIALHCIALHFIGWHCIALDGMASHWMALHRMTWHCIALDSISLHWMAWHCIALDGMAAPLSLAASSISADRWPTHPPASLGQTTSATGTKNDKKIGQEIHMRLPFHPSP